jgi:hypothetical protein
MDLRQLTTPYRDPGRLVTGQDVRPELLTEVDRLAVLVSGRGACKHPDGTVRFIRSSLAMFAADVAAHMAGWCTVARGGVR